MKRLMMLLAAVMLVLALTVPAIAEVDVYADIDKDKDVRVIVDVTITKDVEINVELDATADKAGQADAVLNQSNADNHACENCAEKTGLIVGSILGNLGIVSTNQAVGNMNNQANVVSIAVDLEEPLPPLLPPVTDPGTETGFANSQASASQAVSGNEIDSIFILWRDSVILGSINNNEGIVQVNQSAGNMNNQGNMVALAISLSPGVALSEAALGQANSGNSVKEHNTWKTAQILGSVNANAGIVGVNQTSGNGANQLNGVSMAVTIK